MYAHKNIFVHCSTKFIIFSIWGQFFSLSYCRLETLQKTIWNALKQPIFYCVYSHRANEIGFLKFSSRFRPKYVLFVCHFSPYSRFSCLTSIWFHRYILYIKWAYCSIFRSLKLSCARFLFQQIHI